MVVTADLTPMGGPAYTAVIPNITWSSYQTTLQQWRSSPNAEPSVTTEYKVQEIKNEKEFATHLGINFNGSPVQAGLSLDTHHNRKRRMFSFRLFRNYLQFLHLLKTAF